MSSAPSWICIYPAASAREVRAKLVAFVAEGKPSGPMPWPAACARPSMPS